MIGLGSDKNKKHSYIFASTPRAPLTDDTVPGTRLLAGLLRIWSHLMITIIMRMLMMRIFILLKDYPWGYMRSSREEKADGDGVDVGGNENDEEKNFDSP